MVVVEQMLNRIEETIGLTRANTIKILSACRYVGDLLNMEDEELETDQGKLRIALFRELTSTSTANFVN